MKKIRVGIQIPCLNEEENLSATINEIKEALSVNASNVEFFIYVIDDGSVDKSDEIARSAGVDVINLHSNLGLATAFQVGIDFGLSKGADIIVNTDADNQYSAKDIISLIQPIILSQADVCIGNRSIASIQQFSLIKKYLQVFGSKFIGVLTGIKDIDATSGFRAYSKKAAIQISITSKFSYTLETIFLCASLRLRICTIPVGRNDVIRKSRLFKSNFDYILKSFRIVIRCLFDFKPLYLMGPLASVTGLGAILSLVPFALDLLLNARTDGHIQSLIISSILSTVTLHVLILGLIADSLSRNRQISHKLLLRVGIN